MNESFEIFVVCSPGLESLLIQELQSLDIVQIRQGFSGVYIPKTLENVYRVNYLSRIATRVLWPLASFRCQDRKALYEQAKQVDWKLYLSPEKTFAIDANVSHDNLRNSQFAALVLKDAICDVQREAFGARSSIDVTSPDLQLNLFIQKERAIISFDTSGLPLYKRGWRKETTAAPIQESLASAILQLANYHQDQTLLDPFCGSGTFLIEAAMIATSTPAGFFRKKWGFIHLPNFDAPSWNLFKEKADQNRRLIHEKRIFGIDHDNLAIKICHSHIQATGFENLISVELEDMTTYQSKFAPDLIITNPPYGKRLQSSSKIYSSLGNLLKTQKILNSWVLAENLSDISSMRLNYKRKISLKTGGLDVFLCEF